MVAVVGDYLSLTPRDVDFLRRARRLSDHLVVLMNGLSAPNFMDRVQMLKELSCVDVVMPFLDDPMETLRALKPQYLVISEQDECTPALEELLAEWQGQCILLA
jgi:bifunctional ADP-heptose synthase (sugar kinase/adenylyltransferase)